MNKIFKLLICSAISLSAFQSSLIPTFAQEKKNVLDVVDYEIQSQKTWKISEKTRFIIVANEYSINNSDLEKTMKILNNHFIFKKIGKNNIPMILTAASQAREGDIVIHLTGNDQNERYNIDIGDQIVISSSSLAGILFGGDTVLKGLIAHGELTYGEITDFPQLKERCFFIDIARKHYSKEWIKKQIVEMSWLKMNTLQLHFSENLGFRIECESHPEVMSDEYHTKEDIREIIDFAHDYHIQVIPSLDSPGHLGQALQAHKDYWLKGSEKDNLALDISISKARQFVIDLYEEYMELFHDSKYFHIGGDEFINFYEWDKYPQLKAYAQDVLKIKDGQGVDAYIDWINKIATLVESHHFIPRIWNDGVHRIGVEEKVPLKESIQITYWTQYSPAMAPIHAFENENRDIVNFNAEYFYFVLGKNEASGPSAQSIYEQWKPNVYPSKQALENPQKELGASYALWCDYPNIATEQEVGSKIIQPLTAMANRSWYANQNVSFDMFSDYIDKIGVSPLYEHPDFINKHIEKNYQKSKLTISCVDENHQKLREDIQVEGIVSDKYNIEVPMIADYAYQSANLPFQGTFTKNHQQMTIYYTKGVDTYLLKKELQNPCLKKDYIQETYKDYENVMNDIIHNLNKSLTDSKVQDYLKRIESAKKKLVSLEKQELYIYTQNILLKNAFVEGYKDYQKAIQSGHALLYKEATKQEIKDANENIKDKIDYLKKKPIMTITSQIPKDQIDYGKLTNVSDNNKNTYIWYNTIKDGDAIEYQFDTPILIHKMTMKTGNAKINFKVTASKDGENYELLKEIKDHSRENEYLIDRADAYRYMKIEFENYEDGLLLYEVGIDWSFDNKSLVKGNYLEKIKDYEHRYDDQQNMTKESLNAYQDVIDLTKRAAGHEINVELNEYLITIIENMSHEMFERGSNDKIQKQINNFYHIDKNQYLSSSYKNAELLVNYLKLCLDNNYNYTDSDEKKYLNIMKEALDLLVIKGNHEKIDHLLEMIKKKNLSLYTATSVKRLQTIINEYHIMRDKEYQQFEYDCLYQKLKEAYLLLEKKNTQKDMDHNEIISQQKTNIVNTSDDLSLLSIISFVVSTIMILIIFRKKIS